MREVAEEPLVGGHDAGPLVRVGNTVRRSRRPWSLAVHALLRHLEEAGFTGAPRALGFDERGREVLTYIAGVDGRVARCYDDGALAHVGKMIHSYHQAAASFVPPPGSCWRADPRAPHGTLLCHNDLNPANTIYRDGYPQAFIDWDLAIPSTAVWDLSYAVRTFVPLYSPDDCDQMGYRPGQQTRRLQLFCDAYGMDDQTRHELLYVSQRRLTTETSAFAQRCRETLQDQWSGWFNAITR